MRDREWVLWFDWSYLQVVCEVLDLCLEGPHLLRRRHTRPGHHLHTYKTHIETQIDMDLLRPSSLPLNGRLRTKVIHTHRTALSIHVFVPLSVVWLAVCRLPPCSSATSARCQHTKHKTQDTCFTCLISASKPSLSDALRSSTRLLSS
jgi:hypothetical protein